MPWPIFIPSLKFKQVNLYCLKWLCTAVINSRNQKSRSPFGLIFDIDGVLVRGKDAIPGTAEAFQKLVDYQGKFIFPSVFVTNSCYGTAIMKAQQLTEWLGVMINEEQVVMAFTPLKMFLEYFEEQILVCGQGPVHEIVKELGFKNVHTFMDLKRAFPLLDAVNHQRRNGLPRKTDGIDFPQIKAALLIGEPIEWESALQLLIDLLLTNGIPSHAPKMDHYPHIPLIICNMDLQWMAEACMPRFGHGAFLLCLESLYKKMTGHDLIYTALLGKPSLVTYNYAHLMLQKHAKQIGISCDIEKIYAFGDNVCTDVFGANYFNQVLISKKLPAGLRSCSSILVKTGVYGGETHTYLNHFPRDFHPADKKLCVPEFCVDNVCAGIELIINKEGLTI